MSHDPEVHTMDPADAHPLFLRWMAWRTEGLRIAVILSERGSRGAAKGLQEAINAAISTSDDAIPRTRTR